MKLHVSLFRFVAMLSVSAAFCLSTTQLSAQAKKPTPNAKKITYDKHIKPIFRAKCFGCHNPDKKEGDLDLTEFTTLKVGGGSGEVIEPGDLDGSYLWSLVNHDSQPYMPAKADKLSKPTLDLIAAWITGGALEHSGAKFVRKGSKFDFTLKDAPNDRPKVLPVPTRLSLQPDVRTKLTTAITALATSPWVPLAAVAGQKQVLLYNTQSLELVGVLPYPEGIPHVLKFSRNGSLLLAGGGRGAYQGLVIVWDVKTGQRVFEVGNEIDTVLGADISADQSLIALGSTAKVIRVYSTKSGELLYQIPKKHTEWIYSLEFSPDGVLLATADRAGGLFVWEADTGREYLRLGGHGGAITGVSWRSDSNIVASCGRDGQIRLWEMENGRQVKNWGAHGGGVESVEFCRDGNLVSCGRDKNTKLWKQDGGQIRAFSAFGEMALSVTYCDESKRVIAGDWTGAVKIWNAADGKELGTLSPNPPKLDERLAAANSALAAKQAEHKKLDAAYKAAQAAVDKVKADLATANKRAADLQKLAQTLTNTIKQTKETITKVTKEHATAVKQAAALNPVVPLLKETADKAQQTAAKATGDKELATVAAQLKSLLTKRTATLTALKKSVTEKATALDKSKKALVASEKQAKDTAANLTAARKRATVLTAALKPATEKATAAKKSADAATAAVAATQKQVDRWKAEIDFSQKVNVLSQREVEYRVLAAALAGAKAAVDKTKAELAKTNQGVASAEKQNQAATADVNKVKKVVAQATTAHKTAADAVSALEAAIPLLKDAFTKSQEVAKKDPKDKQLATIAAQLKSVHDKKVAAVGPSKKTLAEKQAALDAAKKQLSDSETQAAKTAAALATIRKQAAEKTAALKTLDAKAAEAKKAADVAQKPFADAQKAVDALKGKAA